MNWTPLMDAAGGGHTDIAIELAKAKADINATSNVCAGAEVEMSRACCCSVSHADAISSITTIQFWEDAMRYAKVNNHGDTVSVLEQVLGECNGKCVCGGGMCVRLW